MLEAVSLGPLRGDGALLRIEQMSGGAILVEQGALDPAPHRLETDALLTAGMTVALAARREEV
jgi:hypothetical protein